MYPSEALLQMREGAAVGIMTSHLLLSLTFYLQMRKGRRTVRGVLWIWVIVGVVSVRSRWVGGGDP